MSGPPGFRSTSSTGSIRPSTARSLARRLDATVRQREQQTDGIALDVAAHSIRGTRGRHVRAARILTRKVPLSNTCDTLPVRASTVDAEPARISDWIVSLRPADGELLSLRLDHGVALRLNGVDGFQPGESPFAAHGPRDQRACILLSAPDGASSQGIRSPTGSGGRPFRSPIDAAVPASSNPDCRGRNELVLREPHAGELLHERRGVADQHDGQPSGCR